MKIITFVFSMLVLSLSIYAQDSLPQCKNANGQVLNGSIDQLKQIMNSHVNRPEVFVTGIVKTILPDDTNGLPHQKYIINVDGNIDLEVVSNLDFGRVPMNVGETISVCGEYLTVGSGMIHWTHFDPHGGHLNGFTIISGHLYGEEETATTGEHRL